MARSSEMEIGDDGLTSMLETWNEGASSCTVSNCLFSCIYSKNLFLTILFLLIVIFLISTVSSSICFTSYSIYYWLRSLLSDSENLYKFCPDSSVCKLFFGSDKFASVTICLFLIIFITCSYRLFCVAILLFLKSLRQQMKRQQQRRSSATIDIASRTMLQ